MSSSNAVSLMLVILVVCYSSSWSRASPVRANKFVAGKPLTQEEFNSPPRYSTPSEWSYIYQAEGDHLFQGDIILPDWAETAEVYVGRNALINRERLWPNATIPYQISEVYDAEQRAIIASAMNEYHLKTCIRFVPHTVEEDYIQIQSISGCSSLIGQVEGGGPQPVSLDIDGCVRTDIVQHELMHAAGFHHEQSRYDRDDYVTIHWDNIQPNLTFNFVKISPERIEFLGTLYNYSSIMHYDAYAFAIDPTKPTITANDGSPLRGYVFAESDLLKLNRQYGCNPEDTCWDDDARFCPDLAANGTCTSNPQEMIIRCKKSCNFCDQPDCYDVAAECHTWAVEGRCETDPDFMKEQGCKRSCLTCLP